MRKGPKPTQKDADCLIGGGPNAFQKYESSDVLPSHAVTRALRLLNWDPKGPEALKKQANAPSFHLIFSPETWTFEGSRWTAELCTEIRINTRLSG
ncbi:MAG: hypothetical protein HRU33_20445 [Rhodobacteraceae bacterium]|nr:hypothetical protein [Paracoccaceae bacterium]